MLGTSLAPRSPVFPACSSARRAKYSPGRPRGSVSLRSPLSPLASPKPAGEGVGRRAPHCPSLPSVSSQKWMAQPRAGKDAGGEQRSQGTPGPASPPQRRGGMGTGRETRQPGSGGEGGGREARSGGAEAAVLLHGGAEMRPDPPAGSPARPPPAAQPL